MESILVTHHHADHTGGIDALRSATGASVQGPATERIPGPYTPLGEGDVVKALGLDVTVLDVPGHTAGHIAFYTPDMDGLPLLFCGDTLFSGGCGRLFEGTPAKILASLDTLAALPGAPRVCCAHEYTLGSLRFALAVEPDNGALAAYEQHCIELRRHGQPTLPTSPCQELLANPFFSTRQAAIMAAVHRFDPSAHDEASVFAALRQWKNQFK